MLEFLNQSVFKITTTLLMLASSILPTPQENQPVQTPNEPSDSQSQEESIDTKQVPVDPSTNTSPLSKPLNKELHSGNGTAEKTLVSIPANPFTKGDHEKALLSVVNIYCVLETLGPGNPLTASGAIIDPKGVIVTNAHVAQYLLLRDYLKEGAIECSIRNGSPAVDKYHAEILYISPEWIEDHKENVFSKNPTGTGKDDYAFLLITKAIDGSNLPESFEFIQPTISSAPILKEDDILLAAYPAGILDPLSIRYALFAMSTPSHVKNLLTFGENRIDVISTGGSYLAQKGSSGGAVINTDGKIIGLFVTSTQEEKTGDRDLRAITLSHIDRSLQSFGNISLNNLLSGDVHETSKDFNAKVSPLLADILIEEIKSR